jgi:hypothetical protein
MIQESYDQAAADIAKDKELRRLVAENPGKWRGLEEKGIRVQDWKRIEGVVGLAAQRAGLDVTGVVLDALDAELKALP